MLKGPDIRLVGEAEAVEEALRQRKTLVPDVVVVDVRFGQPGGLDVLGKLKQKWPRVCVLILAQSPSPHHLAKALALGSAGYLGKRVRREELLKAVRAIAQGERVVEPAVLSELLKTGLGEQLTVPEREVLRLLADGQPNRHIARTLGYSVGTVKGYVQKIIRKLEVSDRTHAAVKATRLGLLD